MPPTPLCEASDPTNVIAEQRVWLITSTQLMNMARLVVPETEAKRIVDERIFEVVSDVRLRFPPVREEARKSIPNSTELAPIDLLAQTVRNYVRDNFAQVTQCAMPATDACATSWLNTVARKAYRRTLAAAERDRFTGSAGLYNTLRSQLVNGYQVTLSVEEATANSVYGLFMSPQLLWRWELGSGMTSNSPPGVFLSDAELATSLSFFLTDHPPDQMLLDAVDAGNLRANIAAHVDRLLMTQTARDWLAKVMRTYFFLNQLEGEIGIDPTKFPIVAGGGVFGDLARESSLFVSDVMWNGKVMDLITSRKAFLNSSLATMVYDVPTPPGATMMDFVETTLPADKRAGLLTNAGFITTRYRPDGVGIIPRGLGVKDKFLCLTTPPPPESINMEGGPVKSQAERLPFMTAQEQVEARKQDTVCAGCHPSFDPYGLVLDWYDVIGKYRTLDHLDKPIDGTTKLPQMIGGQTVTSAVELADVLSKNELFVNCMSRTVLQYGLIDTAVELPIPAERQKGCAAAGIADQVRKSSGKSFTDLTRAVATSPAFYLRKQVQ